VGRLDDAGFTPKGRSSIPSSWHSFTVAFIKTAAGKHSESVFEHSSREKGECRPFSVGYKRDVL